MRRLIRLSAAFALMASTAYATGPADMTEAERAAFGAEVRQYLLDNPEVLMEAMQVLQERQDAAAAQNDQMILSSNHDIIMNDPNSWVGGNPDGDITVVEFMDYRCGYCRKAYDEVADLIKSDGNIRFIVKEFPILGDDFVASSRFAIAMRILHGDAAYEAAHDALIALRGTPDPETLGRLAEELGHPAQPVLDMMQDEKVNAIIAANHALAQQLNITGTPTFVVDKALLRGYLPEEDMRKIVEEQRAS